MSTLSTDQVRTIIARAASITSLAVALGVNMQTACAEAYTLAAVELLDACAAADAVKLAELDAWAAQPEPHVEVEGLAEAIAVLADGVGERVRECVVCNVPLYAASPYPYCSVNCAVFGGAR